MGTFVWRSFIIIVVFIAGLLVGNIFTPKQVLQEKDIVSLVEVKTSIDLDKEDDFSTLSQNQNIYEVYTAFLRQIYQRTKKDYEYQLQNIDKTSQDKKDFIKAQKQYLAIVAYIEQNYPEKQEEASSPEQEPSNLNSEQLPQELTGETSVQIQSEN